MKRFLAKILKFGILVLKMLRQYQNKQSSVLQRYKVYIHNCELVSLQHISLSALGALPCEQGRYNSNLVNACCAMPFAVCKLDCVLTKFS